MFEQVRDALAAAIGELDIPAEAGALTECLGLLDRLTAKVLDGVAAFDRAEAWRPAGAVNMTGWLRTAGCSRARAHEMARTARRLGELPATAAAYQQGALSTGQVQAIVANLDDQLAPLFADAEEGLVPTLAAMTVPDVAATLQTWAQAARDSLADPGDPEPPAPRRRLHLSRTLDGRRELSGSLDPEAGLLAETALRVAQTDDLESEAERSPAQRQADALVDILRFFLDHQQATPTGTRHRPHLNVFLDHHDLLQAAATHEQGRNVGPLGWTPDGTTLDTATVLRLACDAGVHRVITHGRSTVLDYSTTTRTVPAHLFQALVARDRHCRFGDCDTPATRCDAHHVHHWAHGGPTHIANLVLACHAHHHRLHQPHWHAKLLPDATLTVTTPDGHTIQSRPPERPPNLFHPEGRGAGWDDADRRCQAVGS